MGNIGLKISKAYTVLTLGLLGWGTAVVQSPSAAITSSEWIALATIGVATLAVWAVPNVGGAGSNPNDPSIGVG